MPTPGQELCAVNSRITFDERLRRPKLEVMSLIVPFSVSKKLIPYGYWEEVLLLVLP